MDFKELLLFVARKKKLIILYVLISLGASYYYTFHYIKPQFKSSITFLPPKDEGNFLGMIPGLAGGSAIFGTVDIMPQQINTIFNSTVLRKSILDDFGLYEHYKVHETSNPLGLGLAQLEGNLSLSSKELGSLGMTTPIDYSISFFHTSPDTAFLVVNTVYDKIDSTISAITINKAKSDLEYYQTSLDSAQNKLKELQQKFITFQKENKAYDVPEQIKYTLESYSTLKAKKVVAEIEYIARKKELSSAHPSLIVLRDKIATYNKKMNELENHKNGAILGGLSSSTELLPVYVEFLRDLKLYEQMVLLLKQQVEQVSLKTNKNSSILRVVDPAYIAPYKARPKRVFVLATVFSILIFLYCLILAIEYVLRFILNKQKWFKEVKSELFRW